MLSNITMPKRKIDDNQIQPGHTISAVEARRLRVQQLPPQVVIEVPNTSKVSSKPSKQSKIVSKRGKSTAQKRHEELKLQKQKEIALKQHAIELQVAERTSVTSGIDQNQNELPEEYGDLEADNRGPKPRIVREESARARLAKERCEKRRSSGMSETDDIEMKDSSSDEGNSNEENKNLETKNDTQRVYQISNFTPTTVNFAISNLSMEIQLQPGENLAVVGIYKIVVKKGTVMLAGAALSKESLPMVVYAPTTHSIPLIEVPTRKSGQSKLKGPSMDVEVIITSFASGLSDIGKLWTKFTGIWSSHSNPTEETLPSNQLTFEPVISSHRDLNTLKLSPSWERSLTTLTNKKPTDAAALRIMFVGSPGNGKSTFSRLLTNRLFAHNDSVAYLDIDPGQPEFSPPGMISLHIISKYLLSPPFARSDEAKCLRSHHTGYKSPKDDPNEYIAAVKDLLSFYNSTQSSIPLIVNTAGWVKGLGLELLETLITLLGTIELVIVGISSQETPSISDPEIVTIHDIEAAPIPAHTSRRFTSADIRNLQMISYFHRTSRSTWDFNKPLTAFVPWVIQYTGENRGIEAFSILDECVNPVNVTAAIEGTVVGVIVMSETSFTSAISDQMQESSAPEVIDSKRLRPSTFEAKGLAVVRAVDIENHEVHLITPIDPTEIENWHQTRLKVVLVRGRLELPVCEMIVPNRLANTSDAIPWVGFGGSAMGTGKGNAVWKVRRNVMRRAQMIR